MGVYKNIVRQELLRKELKDNPQLQHAVAILTLAESKILSGQYKMAKHRPLDDRRPDYFKVEFTEAELKSCGLTDYHSFRDAMRVLELYTERYNDDLFGGSFSFTGGGNLNDVWPCEGCGATLIFTVDKGF